MRSTFTTTVAWVCLAAVALGEGQLTKMTETYRKELDQLVLDHGGKLSQLREGYGAALGRLSASVAKQGDLDAALAVKRESERFAIEGTVPDRPDPSTPSHVSRLQAAYARKLREEDLAYAQKVVRLAGNYDRALDRLKGSLTKQNMLKGAVLVQQERDRLRASEALSAAQDALRSRVAEEGRKAPTAGRGEGESAFPKCFANRTPEGRDCALDKYGGSEETEAAVLRSLRWLKENQHHAGGWEPGRNATPFTALALLAFLGHGETPDSSEFGDTVKRAIAFLAGQRRAHGPFRECGDHYVYGHAMAASALCEAYALTGDKDAKDVACTALETILRGQQDFGGWNYDYNQDGRNDTSVLGWQMHALKAGTLCRCGVRGLDDAMEKGLAALKLNYDGRRGQFGYTGNGGHPLTVSGIVSFQVAGHADDDACKRAMMYVRDWEINWSGTRLNWPLYRWYYCTLAKFNKGGTEWRKWSAHMTEKLLQAQEANGTWTAPRVGGERKFGPVYSTTMCTLMLETYYRYLPVHAPEPCLLKDKRRAR